MPRRNQRWLDVRLRSVGTSSSDTDADSGGRDRVDGAASSVAIHGSVVVAAEAP